MSSISQKDNGVFYWYGKVDGKRSGKSLGTKNSSKAIREANKLEQSLIKSKSQNLHILNILNLWLTEKYNLSENYRYLAQSYIANFISFDGNLLASQITKGQIILFINYLRRKGASDTYINIQLRTIKAIISWAFKSELITRNPFAHVPIPKAKQNKEFLAKDEIDRLLTASKENKLHQLYLRFLLITGCRGGELQNLKWDNVNTHYIEFLGKTGRRTFPMKDNVREILDEIRGHAKSFTTHVLFDIRTGKPLVGNRAVSRIAKRYIRKAGLKETYTAHTLRHTFASHLVMNGTSIYVVSKLLGHGRVETTERYSHLSPESVNVDLGYF